MTSIVSSFEKRSKNVVSFKPIAGQRLLDGQKSSNPGVVLRNDVDDGITLRHFKRTSRLCAQTAIYGSKKSKKAFP